eukprot:COSAG04_NODE_2525_length_3973_cov_2.129324_4_plen_340_part_01
MAAVAAPALAVNPTGGWALQLRQDPALESTTAVAVGHLHLLSPHRPFPADRRLWGLSGSAPALVALPDAADGEGPEIVNGAGIVRHLGLHRVALDGLPGGHELAFVAFRPRGGGFAFMARSTTAAGEPDFELWEADWAHSGKRSCTCRQLLPGRRFNGALGPPFRWMPDGSGLLVKVLPEDWQPPPPDAEEHVRLQRYSTAVTVLLTLGDDAGEPTVLGPAVGRPLAEADKSEPLAFCVTEAAEGSGERYALIATLSAGVEVWRLEGDGRAQLVTTVANGAPVPPLPPALARSPRALCLIPRLALGAGCAAARGAPAAAPHDGRCRQLLHPCARAHHRPR